MSKLLVMIVGLACAASLAAAEGQPRKVWTARDVIIASGGVPPDDAPAVQAAQAAPGEPAAPAAAPAKAKKSKAKATPKAKKKAAAKGTKKPRAKSRR